jgi:hypothetical protein
VAWEIDQPMSKIKPESFALKTLFLLGFAFPAFCLCAAAQNAATNTLPTATDVQAPTAKVDAEKPAKPVIVLEDTLIRVRTVEPVNGKRAGNGTPVLFLVSEDVTVGGAVAIPRGATVHGEVVESRKSGVLTGTPELALKLTSLDLGGRNYPLYSLLFKVRGVSKTPTTEKDVTRGAVAGAVVGGSISGVSKQGIITDNSGKAASMLAGAVVGAGVGAMVSAGTPGPGIWIPSETEVDFYLASPIAVTPVSAKEAARLAQGLHPGGPLLYLRDDSR